MFSLKNATIAVLIGGAAVLGSYMVQPAEKQPEPMEAAVEQEISMAATESDNLKILGAIEEGEEELVIQENVAFEEFEKPQWDLNKPLLDVD